MPSNKTISIRHGYRFAVRVLWHVHNRTTANRPVTAHLPIITGCTYALRSCDNSALKYYSVILVLSAINNFGREKSPVSHGVLALKRIIIYLCAYIVIMLIRPKTNDSFPRISKRINNNEKNKNETGFYAKRFICVPHQLGGHYTYMLGVLQSH